MNDYYYYYYIIIIIIIIIVKTNLFWSQKLVPAKHKKITNPQIKLPQVFRATR